MSRKQPLKSLYRVAFTGHRPPKIGGYKNTDPLRVAVRNAIKDALSSLVGSTPEREVVVISGGALGVDTDAASVADELNLRFIIVAPCLNQDARWPNQSKWAYADMCRASSHSLADELADHEIVNRLFPGVLLTEQHYSSTCMQRRNEWMVDHCDRLIAVWDGTSGGTANCIAYARGVGRDILRIHPGDLL